ncbi:expansin-A23-like [Citrus clementina]|uniref:expansin-A23-like n=1 Tax=Citrus clementina TaxID=85681 RepID=UPI000CED2D8C|nr:expansin-A23-like [Citrus x clementina]
MFVTKNGAGWQDAQATFYGDMAGRETIAGACGYSSHWLLVLMYNVGGGRAGLVMLNKKIKGSKTVWLQMTGNWGQKWQTGENLMGQSLPLQVTTSDNKMVQFDDVAPSNWYFGRTHEARKNIYLRISI